MNRTFDELSKPAELYEMCRELAEMLSEDLKGEQLMGRIVTVKLKTVEFAVTTRARSLAQPTHEVETINNLASQILRAEIEAASGGGGGGIKLLKLRLMGLRMSSLVHESEVINGSRQGTITSMLQYLQDRPAAASSTVCKHPASATSQQRVDGESLNTVNFDAEENTALPANVLVPNNVFELDNATLETSASLQFTPRDNNSANDNMFGESESSSSGRTLAEFVCPVCNKIPKVLANRILNRGVSNETTGAQITDNNQDDALEVLNRHIDECLNREEIKKLVCDRNTDCTSPQGSRVCGNKEVSKKLCGSKRKSATSASTAKRTNMLTSFFGASAPIEQNNNL